MEKDSKTPIGPVHPAKTVVRNPAFASYPNSPMASTATRKAEEQGSAFYAFLVYAMSKDCGFDFVQFPEVPS